VGVLGVAAVTATTDDGRPVVNGHITLHGDDARCVPLLCGCIHIQTHTVNICIAFSVAKMLQLTGLLWSAAVLKSRSLITFIEASPNQRHTMPSPQKKFGGRNFFPPP